MRQARKGTSMSMTKEQILNEAMALPPSERDEVAEALWQGISPGELTPTQITEIQRRLHALDNGDMQTIPGDQVMQELRQRFQR
jgi:putative addiction module component (TIGR02574 family)